MKIVSRGITIDLPPGWEGEVDRGAGATEPGMERVTTPRVHLANFPMPAVRGDFGSGAVEQMIDGDVLVCLLEESPAAAGSRLHHHVGVPRVQADDFSPSAMQRPLQGQSGTQVFFTEQDRAFVLYVVLGSHASRLSLVDDVNGVLAGVEVEPA